MHEICGRTLRLQTSLCLCLDSSLSSTHSATNHWRYDNIFGYHRSTTASCSALHRVQRAIYARIRQTAPHLRIAHILAYMCLRLRLGATPPPAKRSVHYRGHPTGGPPRGALRLLRSSRYAFTQPDAFGAGASRDGHSRLSHRIKKIGSAREKRMENDFLVNCSTPFLVASRSDATPSATRPVGVNQLFRLRVVFRHDEHAHARAEAAVPVAVVGAFSASSLRTGRLQWYSGLSAPSRYSRSIPSG